MGRRKERRLAAQTAAGRRVKLDLCAEPSGVLADSSVKEVEGDINQDNHAELPSSPSSSGKRQENPLLLLGQYSDDEVTEQPDKGSSHDVSVTSPLDQNCQVEDPVGKSCGSVEESIEGFNIQPIDKENSKGCSQPTDIDGNEVEDDTIISKSDEHGEADSSPLISDPQTSEMQITGDVVSGWKLVMHEETNQYYYWNTETGETSWEVPAILVQGTDSEHKVGSVMVEEDSTLASVHMDEVDGEKSDHSDMISEVKEKYTFEGQLEDKSQGEEGEILETQPKGIGIESSTIAGEHCDSEIALPTRLVNYAESLLQKLRSLERSYIGVQGYDWISKYILEIEIRLADFNTLSVYGSSLLPFWVHSEARIRVIECAINEVSAKSRTSDEVDTGYISSYRSESTFQQSMMKDSKVDGEDQAASPTSQNLCSSPNADTLTIQKEPLDKKTFLGVSYQNISSKVSPTRCLSSVTDANLQILNETACPVELVSKPLPFAAEDIDMDVDMEVDDEIVANHMTSGDVVSTDSFAQPENITHPKPASEDYPPPALDGEFGVPPPPDEDWIPPPPPDCEPVPPPPPDEPDVTAYYPQPTYSETVSLPYPEQYNMSYPVSGYEYYGPTLTEAPSSNYYAHNEGSQSREAQPPQYFDAASSAYSDTASVVVNPMEPLLYYNLPNNGTVPSGPVIGSLESSGFYVESGPVSYHDPSAAGQIGEPVDLAESARSLLPNPMDGTDGCSVSESTQVTAVHTPATVQATTTVQTTSTVQATATVTVKANPPVSQTTADSVVATPSVDLGKNQSKAVRSKKRTLTVGSTLKSNKKVSNLVDKWKAAKVELHEDDEDEPENAYEMLEKKRQKEIEKWRSQQIASGEAKDNANFQPLGGDWRERVKRKRARSTTEGKPNRTEVNCSLTEAKPSLPDTSISEKQQPDLKELSKDLPYGWQAYWDESSKEVYYGNVITSKTTWTRPS